MTSGSLQNAKTEFAPFNVLIAICDKVEGINTIHVYSKMPPAVESYLRKCTLFFELLSVSKY